MCHLGALRALRENNIEIHCVSGSSMGAMAGGLFAAGVSLEKMEELAGLVNQIFVMDLNNKIRERNGLFRARRIMKVLTETIGDLRIEDCPIKYCATGVDVESGELFIFKEGILRDAMRASMAIPAVFTPWEVGGRTYMDGGVLCRLPVQCARDMGADVIIAVDALGPIRQSPVPQKMFGMLMRYFEISDWAITKEKTGIADILITPDMGDKSIFVFKNNEAAAEAGYRATTEVMPQILKIINSPVKHPVTSCHPSF